MHGHLGGGGDVHGSEGLDRTRRPSGPVPCPAAERFRWHRDLRRVCASAALRGDPTRDGNAGGLRCLSSRSAPEHLPSVFQRDADPRVHLRSLLNTARLTWSTRTGVREPRELNAGPRCTASCPWASHAGSDRPPASCRALRRRTRRNNGPEAQRKQVEQAHQLVANPARLARVLDGCPPLGRQVIHPGSGRGDSGFFVSLNVLLLVGLRGGGQRAPHKALPFLSPASQNLSPDEHAQPLPRDPAARKYAARGGGDLDGYSELVGGGPEGLLSKPGCQPRCQVSPVEPHGPTLNMRHLAPFSFSGGLRAATTHPCRP